MLTGTSHLLYCWTARKTKASLPSSLLPFLHSFLPSPLPVPLCLPPYFLSLPLSLPPLLFSSHFFPSFLVTLKLKERKCSHMAASQTLQPEDKRKLNFSSESLNSGSVKRSARLGNQWKQSQIFKKRQREKRDTKTYRVLLLFWRESSILRCLR